MVLLCHTVFGHIRKTARIQLALLTEEPQLYTCTVDHVGQSVIQDFITHDIPFYPTEVKSIYRLFTNTRSTNTSYIQSVPILPIFNSPAMTQIPYSHFVYRLSRFAYRFPILPTNCFAYEARQKSLGYPSYTSNWAMLSRQETPIATSTCVRKVWALHCSRQNGIF